MCCKLVAISQKARLVATIFASALLSGCGSVGGDMMVASNAPPELTAPAAAALAGDLVPRLAEQVGPGKATIVLKPDDSVFASALETALRTWGYAVSTDPNARDDRAIRLTYVLVPSEGQILARLSTGSINVGRIYTVTSTGATPESPVSVMQRN